MSNPSIPRDTLLVLAGKYHVDPRSIVKEDRLPGSVKGRSGERARAALNEVRCTAKAS
jgi:hypothetical protein